MQTASPLAVLVLDVDVALFDVSGVEKLKKLWQVLVPMKFGSS